MAGTARGAQRTAAVRLGMSIEEYDALVGAGLKWCRKCAQWQPVTGFGMDRSRYDGLKSTCQDHPVGTIADRPGARERRIHAAMGERWCRGCKAWLPASQVDRVGACRPCINSEDRARYVLNTPDPTVKRRRAREAGLARIPGWWRQAAFSQFTGQCAYGCRQPANTLDHIWPISRGGISAPGNLVPACKPCNSAKHARDPEPWIVKGFAVFGCEWTDVMALAIEENCDQWVGCFA